MMFYLTSKEFEKYFLTGESDDDILRSQYVIVSTRIKKSNSNYDNILNANAMLFPDSLVCSAYTNKEFKTRYVKQLDGCKYFLATLIKASIEEKYNIVFMCTHKENKMGYLRLLANYIKITFEYPVYDYVSYIAGCKLDKYSKKKVIKKCDSLLSEARHKQNMNSYMSGNTDKILKIYKEKSKKEIKKELESKCLYKKGMSKSEMIDTIEAFIEDFI